MKNPEMSIKEWIYGGIYEQDAREIFLEINIELNQIIGSLKYGEWEIKGSYNKIKSSNRHLLIPERLLKRIIAFFNYQNQYELSIGKIIDIIHNHFREFFKGKNISRVGTRRIYLQIVYNELSLQEFHHHFDRSINEEEYKQLIQGIQEDSKIKEEIEFINELIKKGKNLSTDLIYEYKRIILRPENRRNTLAIFSIILTLILALGTIISIGISYWYC